MKYVKIKILVNKVDRLFQAYIVIKSHSNHNFNGIKTANESWQEKIEP